VFAPGHLGELTRIVSPEMVDAVLAETGRAQRRVRLLPSPVVVYLLLAATLFEGLGWSAVWRKLVAGPEAREGWAAGPRPCPSGSGLSQARQRVGAAPLKALFDLLRGPAAWVGAPGTWWRGLLVCAIDGTTLSVPDTLPHRRRWGKQKTQDHPGGARQAGYPSVRLLALVACGTRAVIDAVFGPASGPGAGETSYAARLVDALKAGMIVLLDRNFGAAVLLGRIHGSGADFLLRLKGDRKTPALRRYPDGSYLSILSGVPGGVQVRVVECEITLTTTNGTHQTGIYRLATSLLDHRAYPAGDLIRLYHQRWEIETAYLELKHTMLGGRVLRATTQQGIEQEIYALLTAYQALRTAITDAALSQPGPHRPDPDRASFSIALEAARDQIINANSHITGTTIDLAGTIGRHVLANLMPPRRLRVTPRVVKRPLSRYAPKQAKIDRTTYKATLAITICSPTPLTTSAET
jgi:hypothetical protein